MVFLHENFKIFTADIALVKEKSEEENTGVIYCFTGMQEANNQFSFLPEIKDFFRKAKEIINKKSCHGI
jgi:hypothetical protein